MQEQQIADLTRRMDNMEKNMSTHGDSLHRIELTLAEVKGGVGIMKWSLPFIVAVGGLTIAAITLVGL